MKKSIVIIALILLSSTMNAQTTHMMGGGITWTCIGIDSFIVNFTEFRNCNGVQIGSANIPFKCKSTGSIITSTSISKPAPVDITPTCVSSCTRCQSGSCSFPYGIEQYVYQKLVVLSGAGSCCEIVMSYSMCCRSAAITTGASGKNFYVEAIMNRCLSPCDNSPAFANTPSSIVCIGQDVSMNFAASDIDTTPTGALLDSLTYEWSSPLQDVDSIISFTGAYDYKKPVSFWGFPNTNLPFPRGFHLDPISGNILFRPMKIEQTVMKLTVKEFRNGTFIGQVSRDIQFIVINCPNNHAPMLTGPFEKNICIGDSVIFNITTNDYDPNDSLTIYLDQSIPGATWTSNDTLQHPTAIFTWMPDSSMASSIPYQFVVTVKDDACPIAGTTTREYHVYIGRPSLFQTSIVDSGCGDFYLSATKISSNNPTVTWTCTNSNVDFNKNSAGKYYLKISDIGIYPIELIANDVRCITHYYDTITTTDSFITAQLPADALKCKYDSLSVHAMIKNAKGNTSFIWSMGDTSHINIVLDSLKNDTIIVFTVSDTTGCKSSDTMLLHVQQIPIVDLGTDTGFCKNSQVTIIPYYYLDNGGYSTKFRWYKTGTTYPIGSNQNKTFYNIGSYFLNVYDDINCMGSDTINITEYSLPIVNAGDDDTLCSHFGNIELKGIPSGGSWIGKSLIKSGKNWFFNSTDSNISNGENVNLHYKFTDQNNCVNSDTMVFTVLLSGNPPDAGSYPGLCLNAGSKLLHGQPIGGQWSGMGIENNTYFNPLLTGTGIQDVFYTSGPQQCLRTDTATIEVFPLPVISLWPSNNKFKMCREEGLVFIAHSPVGGSNAYFTGNVSKSGYFDANTSLGDYPIAWHFTDSKGCYNADTITLSVVEPVIAIDKSNAVACKNNYFLLNAELENAEGLFWMKEADADGYFIGSQYLNTVKYMHGTNDLANRGFWIKVITTDPVCSTKYDSVYIQVGDVPVANFGADITYGHVPFTVNFSDSSSIGFNNLVQWQWGFGDGQTANIPNPVYTYQTEGNYDVLLKVISDLGCADSIIKMNFINAKPSGIEPDENPEIQIYPNPSGGDIFIKSTTSISSVKMYDAAGKMVYQVQELNTKTYKIMSQKAGNYFITIGLVDGRAVVKKLILE